MRIIIAGSRDVDRDWMLGELNSSRILNMAAWTPTIISGGARGADAIGEEWAKIRGLPIERFDADWPKGRGAGFERNQIMAKNADYLLAFWDGTSKGTKHMIDIAIKEGLWVKVFQK